MLARSARRILWSLPEQIKVGFSALYWTLRPREAPPPEVIDFAPDLADRDGLRAFLLDADPFGAAVEEGAGYLWHALERFRITLAITPDLPSDAKVLELGANPYFFTRMLLRRGLDVTCANWFGYGSKVGITGSDVITSQSTGERLVIDYDHFDIEVDRFPYDDGTFDAVFFCEILEHLPLDPVHALVEIHRVLKKPKGLLVLSTPNPVRTENLAKMIRGENVYEPVSGYGIHGRHNREYTVGELRSLFEELGFDPIRAFTSDVSPGQPSSPRWFPGLELADRGEYVFAVARAHGSDRWRYPGWLYQSRQALWRVVLPHMEVGRNDDLQTDGFHHREVIDGREVRWLGNAPNARVLLSPRFGGPGLLRIEGLGPPPELGEDVVLYVQTRETESAHEIACGSWFSLAIPVEVLAIDQEISLRANRTFIPRDVGIGEDRRALSVAIASVAFEPQDDDA